MSDLLTFQLILLLPALSGLVLFLFRNKALVLSVSIPLLVLTVALSLFLWSSLEQEIAGRWEWLPGISMGWRLDEIALSLVTLVSLVSLLVHVFSYYYMGHDPGIHRYYLKLGFFTSAMIGLLGADHLILVFFFWELVGFFSYLLIGFWFRDPSKAQAARNAFITNRVADVCLLFGIISLGFGTDTFFISELTLTNNDWVFVGCTGILLGAMGKSAQFPFHTWLPHAMAGPTPVSALIHAATMVAAGVYLLVRIVPFFPWELGVATSAVGAFTALMAAYFALTQFDIKKVLAYSTISQLGYMVMAAGFGAVEMAFFHLWTHAFFKAGLFLAVGVIIHQLSNSKSIPDAQDIRYMGGLRQVLPVTFWTFSCCMAALMGLPFFTGFLSKDGILAAGMSWSSNQGEVFAIIPVIGFVVVFLTAFYMIRLWKMVFFGPNSQPRHSEPIAASLPLILLALGSLWFWYSPNPIGHQFAFLDRLFGSASTHATASIWIAMVSVFLAVGGGLVAWRKKHGRLVETGFGGWSYFGLYLDQLYQKVIVRSYNGLSNLTFTVDRRILDGAIHAVAIFTVVLSKLVQAFDQYMVDGVINFAAYLSKTLGDVLRRQQAYSIQLQLFWVLLAVAGVLWFLLN